MLARGCDRFVEKHQAYLAGKFVVELLEERFFCFRIRRIDGGIRAECLPLRLVLRLGNVEGGGGGKSRGGWSGGFRVPWDGEVRVSLLNAGRLGEITEVPKGIVKGVNGALVSVIEGEESVDEDVYFGAVWGQNVLFCSVAAFLKVWCVGG
jgi:hypothetical protein